MKITLIAASTINGIISKSDHTTDWSKEDWENFKSHALSSDVIIIGKKTYDLVSKNGIFIKNIKTIVMTHKKISDNNDIEFTDKNPIDIVNILKIKGYKNVLIAGGGEIYKLFLEYKLVDEIILDLEPKIYGIGTKLFSTGNFFFELKLLKIKKLNKNTLCIKYKVLYN